MSITKKSFSLFFSVIFSILVFFSFGSIHQAYASVTDNVYGGAWSDNVGWINFNNCASKSDTSTDCTGNVHPPTPSPIQFGVSVDLSSGGTTSGDFSGEAWSDNVGWISFNERSNCPTAPCTPHVDFTTGEITGWARALTFNVSNGGWDGWINLAATGHNDGWNLDVGSDGTIFSGSGDITGAAWGDLVLGWVVPQTLKVDLDSGITISVCSSHDHGSIDPDTTVTVTPDDTKIYTITPDDGYVIKSASVDGSDVSLTGNTYTFTNVTSDTVLCAVFSQGYDVTSSASAHGTIAPLGKKTVAAGDDSPNYSITASSGYAIKDVQVDTGSGAASVGTPSAYTITNIQADSTIHADFALARTITACSNHPNGTLAPSGNTTVADGNNQTYTISPDTNYQISKVTVDGSSVGAVSSYTFTNVTSNHTICATFKANGGDSTITACSSHPGGAITPEGDTSVAANKSQKYAIKADDGYTIQSLLIDGVSGPVVSSYTFTKVTSDHEICATFEKNDGPYTISACLNPEHGTIAPGGDSTVNSNGSKSYVITPDTGYHINTIIVDGSPTGTTSSPYNFSSVTSNHTICPTFSDNVLAQCKNLTDDDGDGLVDYSNDPNDPGDSGCTSPDDTTEKTVSVIYTEH
jgi:hypothetical protein